MDDLQLGLVKVDILPAEPEQLPAPQPEVERQDVQRRQPVTGGSSHRDFGLLCGQAPVDLVPRRGHLNQLGHVARDDLLAHRRLQRVAEYGVGAIVMSTHGYIASPSVGVR
jgi:hypothetical protein